VKLTELFRLCWASCTHGTASQCRPTPRWLAHPRTWLLRASPSWAAVGSGKKRRVCSPSPNRFLRIKPLIKTAHRGLLFGVKGIFCARVNRHPQTARRAEDYTSKSALTPITSNPLHNDLDAYALATTSLRCSISLRTREDPLASGHTNLVKFIILLAQSLLFRLRHRCRRL